MRLKLDSQYRFLHINFNENDSDLKYDSLNTVRNFCILDKKVGIWGIFRNILEENDLEINPFVNIIEDPKVIWMDYRTNYLGPKKDFNDEMIDDIDDEEDDEQGPRFLPIGMFGGQDRYDMTPWGKFIDSDPMNPMNLYDEIHVVHFRGFSFEDLLRLELTMNSIRGVARWSMIDKYSAIICVSKTYTSQEVKQNVEDTLYANLNHKKLSTLEEASLIAQHKSESNKTDHFLIVYPNGNEQLIENPSEQDVNDVDNLLQSMGNCIVFKNGEIYEGRDTDQR